MSRAGARAVWEQQLENLMAKGYSDIFGLSIISRFIEWLLETEEALHEGESLYKQRPQHGRKRPPPEDSDGA